MLPHRRHTAWACLSNSQSVTSEAHQGMFGKRSGSGRGT
ncbi:hypothetical protein IEO21_10610 [Rhodonia placenta]|uniref:Uncharacterized protein n=1 Tax=Rhodonia placenta TaxID=104341 RepID=A0A8H7TX98_9APHY|nr:hypothetical protein IEO21_10610 [Postia placenta]